MNELERIWSFLRAVRTRARVEVALRRGALTLVAACNALIAMAAVAAAAGPAAFWPMVATGVLLSVTLAGAVVAGVMPAVRLRRERSVAQLVGRRHPPIASDLVSAVELAEAGARTPPEIASPALTNAFFGSVAASCEPIEPRRIVPLRTAGLAVGGAMLACLVTALLVLRPGAPLERGLALLFRQPTRFEGAVVSREPLVGDIKITYEFPAYTGLPPRTVEGSSGDVVAVKGTRVRLSMKAMRSARKALLLLGEHGEGGELPTHLEHGAIDTSFVLETNGVYRVWLAPLLGRPLREARGHRIEAEADRPPQVEIYGPADRLQLASPRPVEVAYAANDDFGLGALELVYRIEDGPEQRIPLREAGGARTAQGKTLFSPTLGPTERGVRVAYRIDAVDRDAVSGAKRGSSRTLYLVIERPRENSDERLAQQREVLEQLIETLADRLELGHQAKDGATSATGFDAVERAMSWQKVHEGEESHVATLGRLIDEERRAASGNGKALVTALAGIADRLGKLLREEVPVLTTVRTKAASGVLTAAALGPLLSASNRHVDELERAVLLLDDLIGRQRLEELAELGRELTDAYKRLEDLLARYNATKDPALRAQLEREIRDLRTRLAELAQKVAELKGRNDVPSEWQNMPDLREAAEKLRKMDQALEKGDSAALSDALAELGRSLAQIKNMLDQNADSFTDERFPQERKAMAELMKKIGDLEGDERALAGDTAQLAAELEAEMKKRAGQEIAKKLSEIQKKAAELGERLGRQTPRNLGESAQEELGKARESAARLKDLLAKEELGEARAEAERAASSLDKVERGAKRQASRSASSAAAPLESFASEMGQAGGTAREITEALGNLVPGEGDMASAEQRQRASELAERQSALERRAKQLGEEMGKKASELPGMERAQNELGGAAEQMGKAQGQLRKGTPREATGNERDAVERLARLRESLGNEGGSGNRGSRQKEPVRIPGADDSRAPKEWRQELMEAMREKAPERFKDEVRRYYEELVK